MEDTEEKKWCVYMHTSPSNKAYIGITSKKPEVRWGKNGANYKNNNHLWSSICKYGWYNFEHIIWEENLTKEDACKIEKMLIAIFETQNPNFGYNIASGGESGFFGCHMSDDAKMKLSKARTGRKFSPHSQQARENISRSLTGRVLSNETKNKLSNIQIEKWKDDEYRKNQIETHKWQTGENHPWYGRKHSQESKEKMRYSHTKNSVFCPELNMMFKSSADAKRQTGIDDSDIRKVCKGIQESAGKHPVTGEKLHWIAIEKEIVTYENNFF